jgi:hypothetical protein
MKKPNSLTDGVCIAFALSIVLLFFKLTVAESLSWWWVTFPLWGPVAIGVLILIVSIIAVIAQYGDDKSNL